MSVGEMRVGKMSPNHNYIYPHDWSIFFLIMPLPLLTFLLHETCPTRSCHQLCSAHLASFSLCSWSLVCAASPLVRSVGGLSRSGVALTSPSQHQCSRPKEASGRNDTPLQQMIYVTISRKRDHLSHITKFHIYLPADSAQHYQKQPVTLP